MSSDECRPERRSPLTTFVHAGEMASVHGEVMPSICLSTTFRQSSPGVPVGEFDYIRSGNPTRKAFEQAIAESEGGQFGFAFSSGLAALTSLLCVLKTGDKVLSIDDVYGGVDRLLSQVAVPQWGLQYQQISMQDMDELRAAVHQDNVKMVWIESPTNPTLRVVDIRRIVDTVRGVRRDVLVVVDNTFASPYLQQPLQLGADVVLHSVTKYIGGHSDVLMGAVVTDSEAVADRLRFLQMSLGAVASPFDCFMALRGLKTLAVRMRQHCEGAARVAGFLSGHAQVAEVLYPGLPSHPQHEVARGQMRRGFGGMVSFRLKGSDPEASVRFTKACRLATLAESLGGVESLVEVPSVMTHVSLPAEKKAKLGITDSLLRLSVGIECPEDLIADLDNALQEAALKRQ